MKSIFLVEEMLDDFKTFNFWIILIFLLFSNQLTAQFEAEILDIPYEEGKIIVSTKIPELVWNDSIRTRLKKEVKGYYLVFLPPVFKTKQKTLVIPIDASYQTLDTLSDSIQIAWMYDYSEGYLEPYISTRYIDRNCLSVSEDSLINIEFTEIRPFKRLFKGKVSKTDYENGLIDTLYHTFDYHFIEIPYRIIKTPNLNPNDYENIDYLKLIYLKGFNWSEFREVMCTGGIRLRYLSLVPVQIALRDKGYGVEVGGNNDEKFRKILNDFQRENGLKVGWLNVETLKMLDVDFTIFRNKYQYYRYKDAPIGPNYKN